VDASRVGDVLERIAVEQHEIAELPRLDGPQLVVDTEDARRGDGRGP
jgi:hypothetical protein